MAYTDDFWLHKKTNGRYRIVGFAVEEATLTPLVVYQKREDGEDKGPMFTRPCAEFFDGRFRQAPAAKTARSVPPAQPDEGQEL